MQDDERLAQRFEEHRPLLRAVAYRMLGSPADAEDAIQNAWLRFNQTDTDTIDNLSGWLTTVIGRECLHLLRANRRRREDLLDPVTQLPDPIVTAAEDDDPEQQAVLADSVSLALLVVLDSFNPAERLAFVLHDIFDVPFDEIGPLVERTPAATRQLASRARRRVRGHELPYPTAIRPDSERWSRRFTRPSTRETSLHCLTCSPRTPCSTPITARTARPRSTAVQKPSRGSHRPREAPTSNL